MITKLSKKQELALSVYREKHIAMGLNTDRINREQCKKDIDDIYINILQKKSVPTVILDNPLFCWIAVNMFNKNSAQVRASVNDQVYAQVCDQVYAMKLISFIMPYLEGSFDVNVFAFYDFMINELDVKINSKILEKYNIWKRSISYGYIFTLDNICFVSEKPLFIFKNDKGLHCDLKPALSYAGDLNIYFLNGVRMPSEIVLKNKEELSCNLIHSLNNAEQRQEFVKKIGLSRVLSELGNIVLDEITAENLYKQNPIANYIQQGDVILEPENEENISFENLSRSFIDKLKKINYKLVCLNLNDNNKRPYLYMTNASLPDESHIEGVPENIKTVFDAICWRNNKKSLPMLLS